MAVFSEQVADVLDWVDRIDFDMGSLRVRSQDYGAIASAIRDSRIGVISSEDLDDGVHAAYSSMENVIYYRPGTEDDFWDPWVRSKFVHEATHALHDWCRRTWLSRIDNEATCFVSQMVFLLNNVGAVPASYRKDVLFKDISDAAIEVAYAITGKPNMTDFGASYVDALPELDDASYLATGAVWPVDIGNHAAFKKLRAKLGSKGAYPENVGKYSTDCLGIPVRGKIKSVEHTHNRLVLSIGKKSLQYDWDAQTSFVNSTGHTLKLGPKDPELVPGRHAIVVCENAGKPQYANIIRSLGA